MFYTKAFTASHENNETKHEKRKIVLQSKFKRNNILYVYQIKLLSDDIYR